ncbi:hypothetical protein HY621_03695 [Candidatus Uhrbacteria bacterium]|nr:hypothetical protein [Candidatus Uhrbacteria bacterium]
MQKVFFLICVSIFLPLVANAQTIQEYDVAATVGSITFVPSEIHAGEQTRIYGSIVNVGRKDISGYVGFYQGVILLGKPQPFSLKANGVPEEFWVDWVPTEGTYNVMMTVIETEPADQNPGNNVSITRMLTITKRPPPVSLAPIPPSQVAPPSQSLSSPISPPSKKQEPLTPTDKGITPPQQKSSDKKVVVTPIQPIVPQKKSDQASKIALKHFILPGTTTTLGQATTTPARAPFAEAFSNEFTKSVGLFQSESPTSSTPTLQAEDPAPVVQPKDSSSSSGIMVGGIIAVLLFLIGLLFLKKSKPE